jgi:DNA polymerase-3 subunit alpha
MTDIPVDRLSNLEALGEREVRFAGLVSNSKKMTSRTGEGFGSMTIDDYSGSYELKLYGQEYGDFAGFFQDDTFIYCRGRVTVRSYTDKSGNPRVYSKLHINTMMYLANVMDRYTSKLTFKVNLSDIDEEFCRTLEKLAKKHKGKVPLQATVIDPVHNLSLTMGAPGLRVSAREALDDLEKLKGVYDIKPQQKS